MTREERDPLTHAIIGAAIEVHREFGPGILESAFEECLCFELANAGLSFQRQVALPVVYKGQRLQHGFRPDLIIENAVVVELKNVEKLLPVHDLQLLTYLKLTGITIGLLINIQANTLIAGVKRLILSPSATPAFSAFTSDQNPTGSSGAAISSPPSPADRESLSLPSPSRTAPSRSSPASRDLS